MSNTLTLTFPLDLFKRMTSTLELINSKTNEYAVWEFLPSCKKELVYFTGVNATLNPSGAANIERINYIKNGVTVMTQYFKWDGSDNLLEIGTVAYA